MTRPLLRSAPPLEDELLSSYLWRLSKLNRYDTPNWLWQLCDQPRHLHSGPDCRELLWSLSLLTGQSVSALYDLTLHALAERLAFEHIPREFSELEPGVVRAYADPHTLNRTLRSERAVQWCPRCLEEALYFRKRWLAPLVGGCPEHCTLLAQACPVCHQKVGVLEVLEGRCRACQACLAHPVLAEMRLTRRERQGQVCVHAWLQGQELETPEFWPRAPGAALFQFLWGLVTTRAHVPRPASRNRFSRPSQVKSPSKTRLENRTPLEVLKDVAQSLEWLEDWPLNFHRFLKLHLPQTEQVYPNPHAPQISEIRWERAMKRIGPLWTEWLEQRWTGEPFEWLHDEVDDVLAKKYSLLPLVSSPRAQQRPRFIYRLERLDHEELGFVLGEEPKVLTWLTQCGWLEEAWTRDTAAQTYPKVLALKARLARRLTLGEVSQLLRLKVFAVQELIEGGSLPFERVSVLEKEPRFLWSEVRAVLKPLLERIEYFDRGLSLEQATRRFHLFGLEQADLLEAVLEGKLTMTYLYGSALQKVGNVWAFSYGALEHYGLRYRKARGWLSLRETASLLKVRTYRVLEWTQAQVLPCVPETLDIWPHFLEAEVENFSRRFVSAHKAGVRLGVTTKQVKTWGHSGVLGAAYRHVESPSGQGWPVLEWDPVLEWWEGYPPERRELEAKTKAAPSSRMRRAIESISAE